MPSPMPTLADDVVLSRTPGGLSGGRSVVWRVKDDGEQSAHPSSYVTSFNANGAAACFAQMLSDERPGGAIYLLETDTLNWTTLPAWRGLDRTLPRA